MAATTTLGSAATTTVSLRYDGLVVSAAGQPLSGRHELQLSCFAPDVRGPLYVETHHGVEVTAGRFIVVLGGGTAASGFTAASLAAAFASHPELALEVAVDGTLQAPRIAVLPAGHSNETRARAAGAGSGTGDQHAKGYRVRCGGTAVPAAALRPAGSAPADPYTDTHKSNPFLVEVDFLGVSTAVRDLPAWAPDSDRLRAKEREEGREINPIRHEDLFDEDGIRYGTRTEKIDDRLAAESAVSSGRATPPLLVDVTGIGATGYAPPDTEGAVGPDHYVQVVNVAFRVFDKSGTPVDSQHLTNSLWSGFGGPCASNNDGDAIFLYDEHADRWVFTQFAISSGQAVCFAVSTGPDPTGTYSLYQVDTVRFPDYYKLGVWPDPVHNAYFMGTNTGYGGQYDVYAVDRASMLAGTPARAAQYFQNHPNLLMPADLDGDDLPPNGTPGLFYTFRDGGESYFEPPSSVDTVDLWEFAVDWTTPANTTFTLVQSIVPPELADFNWSVCGFFVQNCLPQPGGGVSLDSASWWPMQRLQYRNFGLHETLAGTWTVDVNASGNRAAPRWFELRRDGGSWVVDQQGTFSPDAAHRWMPSVALDGSGNMALGYSVVDAATTTYPSLRYATRAKDAANFDAEASIIAGSGAETGANRWGDYASMEVDPADDCTFWFTSEYIASSGGFNWATRIASFKVPSCTGSLGLAVDPPSREVCASAGSATWDVTLELPFTGTTNLSSSGCPSGATCSFSPNPVLFPATTSTFTVSGLARAGGGRYDLTVTATDAAVSSTTMSAGIDLTLYAGNPPATSLVAPADGATGVAPAPTLSWAAVSGAASYTLVVATDPAFTAVVASASGLTATSHVLTTGLDPATRHYWRVQAVNTCGPSAWSSVFDFTTALLVCSTPNLAIPDNTPGGVADTRSIATPGTITALALEIEATHPWVGDLSFTLTNTTTGTSVVVVDRPGAPASFYGCAGDDVDVTLDDAATNPVETACGNAPALAGTLRPENQLATFAGQSLAGSWTLTATDSISAYTGTLVKWCMLPGVVDTPLFADGFELGTTGEWSAVTP